jgi:hypothetical protein
MSTLIDSQGDTMFSSNRKCVRNSVNAIPTLRVLAIGLASLFTLAQASAQYFPTFGVSTANTLPSANGDLEGLAITSAAGTSQAQVLIAAVNQAGIINAHQWPPPSNSKINAGTGRHYCRRQQKVKADSAVKSASKF